MKVLAATETTTTTITAMATATPLTTTTTAADVAAVSGMQQRLKCGTVYTWECTGEELEQFAVECALCDDRPLCKLSEFALHMEIWHQNAEEAERNLMAININDANMELNLYEETSTSLVATTTKELQFTTVEPFEQVLITNTADDIDGIDDEVEGDVEGNVEGAADVEGEEDVEEEVADDEGKGTVERAAVDDVDEVNMNYYNEYTTTTKTEVPRTTTMSAADFGSDSELEYDDKREIEDFDDDADADDDDDDEDYDEAARKREECNKLNGMEIDVALLDPTKLNANQQIQFGLNEPLTHSKLTTSHIEHLIELYEAQPRLWQQTHNAFHDRDGNRRAWQQITERWAAFCGRQFSRKEVQMRLSTLYKRIQQQTEALANSDERETTLMAAFVSDGGGAKEQRSFKYYEKMQFLKNEQPFLTRRSLAERENVKLLEIYAHFPVLWHSDERSSGGNTAKRLTQRAEALRNISTALALCNIQMPTEAVQRRLKILHKNFRNEKIRHLHCKVEQRTFLARFKHYEQMLTFLDEHVEPYVCVACGKIYQHLMDYREHCQQQQAAAAPWLNCCQQLNSNNNNNSCSSSTLSETIEALEMERKELLLLSGLESDSAIDVNTPSSEQNSTTTELDLEATPSEANSDETTTTTTTTTINGEHFELTEEQQQQHQMKALENVDVVGVDGDNDELVVVKVDCGQFSYDLNLAQQQQQHKQQEPQSQRHDSLSSSSASSNTTTTDSIKAKNRSNYARLNVQQTRKLIGLYRDCPQLWDPEHAVYASRKARALAWRTLTARMNRKCGMRYTWRMLHRKITDFVKYYKRERQRCADSKWYFYDDFHFIDRVLNATSQLQKSLQHKTNNLKIIEIYRMYPQLWNTQHADYSKRKERQRHFTHMCQRLQEESNIQITGDKLKQRLIEFRCNYRLEKQQRLAASQRNETFNSHYEFYEELAFLEPHVAPFQCAACQTDYKRRSDYVQHMRKFHATMLRAETTKQQQANGDAALEHVCHICGMAFTARNNLVYHLKRHLGERQHSCHLCPKVFYNTTSLRVHIRSHTKELPYICELCGVRFVNASKLNQHRKRHLNQRDFACDKCDKTFYTAFELDRHQRRHLNIRDKICPICGRAFFVGSAYYAHMRLHSDVKRYACELCDIKFAQYAGLYKHRKRHHAE